MADSGAFDGGAGDAPPLGEPAMKRCKSELEARGETKARDAQAMPGVHAASGIMQILDECEELWGKLVAKHGHPLRHSAKNCRAISTANSFA